MHSGLDSEWRMTVTIVNGEIDMSNDDDLVTALDCADIAVSYTDGEVVAQNTLSFLDTDGGTSRIRLQTLVDFMHDWHTTQVMPFLSIEAQSLDTIGIGLTTFPNDVTDSHPKPNVNGTGGAAIPMVCCFRIDFQTGNPWPHGIGRNFVTSIPESVVNKSHVDVTWANNIKTAYDTLPIDIAPTHWQWVVLSRRFGGINRASAVIQPVISVTIPDLRIRTYRQRLPRFGT